MLHSESDTIAAVATAMNQGGINIIRISGPESIHIISRIFSGKMDFRSHTVYYGHIVDGSEVIDEVMVLILKAPKTYTKEDVVEIDCHGGIVVTKRILDIVLKNGARLAEPGEFTKRAFLNGRIDLSQAEAVMDVISSKNEYALKNSMAQLSGKMKQAVEQMRDVILHDVAYIEAALDDPEHISLDGFTDTLENHVKECKERINSLLDTVDNGRMIKEGIRTVILGKPNAGKSSLLNFLLGEDRAIVTDIPGTTRDILEETMNLGGIFLNIIDTAGIRNTEDFVEQIGVDKAKKCAQNADLILYVVDNSVPFDENDEQIIPFLVNQKKKGIILLNKSDLESKVDIDSLTARLPFPLIAMSAKEEEGMEELTEEIHRLFFKGKLKSNEGMYVTNTRHQQALKNARLSLDKVLESIEMQMPEDFYTIDLMESYQSLGTIIGQQVEDDLVDKVFREFCMGK